MLRLLSKSLRNFDLLLQWPAVLYLCVILSGSKAAGTQPPWLNARVSTWFEDRPSACTLSFDSMSAGPTAAVAGLLVEHDMRGTFFSSMDSESLRQPNVSGVLRHLLDSGHEIGGRPFENKPFSSEEIQRLNEQMEKTFKKEQIQEGRTYSYPQKDSSGKQVVLDKINRNVLAARTVDTALSGSTPANMLRVSAFPVSLESSKKVQQAITNGEQGKSLSWVVFGDSLAGKGLDGGYKNRLTRLLWYLYKKTDMAEVWIDTFGQIARYILQRNNLEISVELESSGTTVRSLLSSICHEVESEFQSAISSYRLPIVTMITLRMKKPFLPPEPVYVTHCVTFNLLTSPVQQSPLIDCHLFRPNGNSLTMRRCRCRETMETDKAVPGGEAEPHYTCCWDQVPRLETETMHLVLHRPCPIR